MTDVQSQWVKPGRNSKHRAPRIRVAVALTQGQQILLVRHEKNGRSYWLLPGGGLEFGESLRDAAARELREETGLLAEVGPFLMAAETLAPDRSRHVVHMIFRATCHGGLLEVGDQHLEPHERRIVEVRWVDWQEVDSLVIHPPFSRQLLQCLQAPLGEESIYIDNLWID